MASSLVQFSNTIADAVERAGTAVVGVLEGGREGVSGILWKEGIVITAEHTIRGYDEVTIVLPSGEKTKASVAGRDSGTDIAVLKLQQKTDVASIAVDSPARVGEVVLAVGRPGSDGLAATYGVISAVGGPWRTWQGARVDRWLRLDLNPFTGFSGGPIVNASGEVLGMATSGPRHSVATIAASTVTRVVDQLLKRGRIARGYLGIGVQPVTLSEATRSSLGITSDRGLLIATLASDSPAEKSGLLLGDILLAVDGSPVRGARSLLTALDPENVGKSVAIELMRGGKLLKLAIVVGERPGR
jgi:S1-C subfamily serine protease